MKKLFILPILAVVFAAGSAFGTHAIAHADSKLTNFPGYIKNNPLGTSCTESVMCSNIVAELCTVNGASGGAQLWAKNAQDRCVTEVYRIH